MVMKKKVNPEGYVVGPDATIEDIDLDKEVVHYQGERLTEARAALRQYPADLMDAFEVSPRVNAVKHDDPGLIEPAMRERARA